MQIHLKLYTCTGAPDSGFCQEYPYFLALPLTDFESFAPGGWNPQSNRDLRQQDWS